MATYVNPAYDWDAAYAAATANKPPDPYANLSGLQGLDLTGIGLYGPYVPPGGGGSPAPPPPPPPPTPALTATGATRTQRRLGGWVDVLQQMSDGSWQVVDSYQDMGARDSALALFRNAGLDDTFINGMMAAIDGVYQQNLMPTEAQVLGAIYNSDAYKTRFAANETIRKRIADGKGRPGDRLLTPKEYLDLENSYRTIMQDAGMPTGFYDQQEDFTNLIANGVSVGEMKARVDVAFDALNNADEFTKTTLSQFYGLTTGDLVAYLLDPTRATPLLMGESNEFGLNNRTEIEKGLATAKVGADAARQGLTADQGLSREIVDSGQQDQARAMMGMAAAANADLTRLGSLYSDPLDYKDLVRETLNLTGGAASGKKRRKLASKERAAFSGQSALDRTSLRRETDV